MKCGDIVLVTYPFTDLSREKLRPAFVVLPEDDKGEWSVRSSLVSVIQMMNTRSL